MSPPEDPIGRFVVLAIGVPLVVGSRLVEVLPDVAGRVRREIVLARFIGKLAVDQGVRELRERLAPTADEPGARGGSPDVDDVSPESIGTSPEQVVSEGGVDAAPSPAAGSLALADYDHLSAAQVVAKLAGLDLEERAAIEIYELRHRHRRTILGKLAQLHPDGATS